MDKHPLNEIHPTHYYDDIEERDYPLPTWWRRLFYLCVIFAAIYYGHYQLGGGQTIAAEYEESWKAVEAQQAAQAKSEGPSAAAMEALAHDPKVLARGKDVFSTRCAVCHGPDGQGVIGPNLTDAFWIHGDGKGPGILKIVAEGVPAKGMPTWGTILPNEEVQAVAAYVRSLRGSSPPNAKPPQGEEYRE